MKRDGLPPIVIPDTHGCLAQVETLIEHLRRTGELTDHQLIFLGDYVDRGPEVRGLVDLCVALQSEGHVCISGNHEYVLTHALDDGPARDTWIARWARHYESKTLESYGVKRPEFGEPASWQCAADELREAMPKEHLKFLASLPLVYETDGLIAVHAGLESDEPWEAQREKLLDHAWVNGDAPNQLFSHDLADTLEQPTPKLVVSGHAIQKRPVVAPGRILLNCGVELGGPLVAWVSDTDSFIHVE